MNARKQKKELTFFEKTSIFELKEKHAPREFRK